MFESFSSGVVVSGGEAAKRPADTTVINDFVLGGCVSSDRGCQCYTKELQPIPLPDYECRNLSSSPLPMNLKISAK